MRLGMFDPANDSSYHTLSPADVNTADSQVAVAKDVHRFALCIPTSGIGIKTGTREYCATPK